jgi:hypothetical protein
LSDIEKARLLFQEAGLAFPTIPEELAARLKERGKWLFSTRELEMSPYNLQHFVGELDGSVLEQCGPVLFERNSEVTRVSDYALLCHSGHGVNSYALQYYLIYGRLALFLHLGWGGVYMDAAESAAQIRDCFALADAIVPAVEASKCLVPNSRVTIVGSDFYGSYWAIPGENRFSKAAKAREHTLPYGAPDDEEDNTPVEVLTSVLHWLKSRPQESSSATKGAAMSRDFLAYWKPSAVDAQLQVGGELDHAAGSQYRRTRPGDTVWLVTIRGGRLRLVTRIMVEHVTDQAGAGRLLGVNPSRLWRADWHIVAVKGTEWPILDVDIHHLTPVLRFESKSGHDRLNVESDGTITAQQLQTMRVLSQRSAELLAAVGQQT